MSKSQALLLIAASIAYAMARVVAGPISAPQLILILMVLEFVVQPLSTLLHECGHAIVARRVSSGPVSLIVGRGPYLSGTLGGVRMNFSMLPSRGVRIRGVCRYEPGGVSWRDRAAVSLAGPIATFLELLVALTVALRLWPDAQPLARNLLALVVIGLGASVLANLIPNTIIPGVISNDGANAQRSLRNHRARTPTEGRPKPVGPAAPTTVTRGPGTNSTGRPVAIPPPDRLARAQPHTTMSEQDRDRARAATSVPPPTSHD